MRGRNAIREALKLLGGEGHDHPRKRPRQFMTNAELRQHLNRRLTSESAGAYCESSSGIRRTRRFGGSAPERLNHLLT
jgi:hypothetical protein